MNHYTMPTMSTLFHNMFSCFIIYFILTSFTANAEVCPESWRLERNSTNSVFVSFINGTFPGRYTSLIWHWAGTELKGEWETTLWKSFVSDNMTGSMAFRDGEGTVPVSLMWKYQGGNLTWFSRRNPLTDVNWSIKVCNMPTWSYESDNSDNWIFTLGNIKLDGLEGEKTIYSLEELITTHTENLIISHRKKRHILRILGGQQGHGERGWEIIRELLDRVFGNSDTIKEEGWISHITNFLYLIISAIGSAASSGGESNGITSRPAITTTLSPEVETFSPTELDNIKETRSPRLTRRRQR